MEYFQTACLIIVIYLCTYGIINRVCNCIEKCSANKAISKTANKADLQLNKVED